MDNNDTNTVESTEQKPVADPVKKADNTPKISLAEVAEAIAKASPGMKVRETTSTTYRNLATVENAELNWKKGLIYSINLYAGGAIIELQLYSSKKGAHLAQFKNEFNQFAGAKIGDEVVVQRDMGLATRLRVKLPFAGGIESVAKNGAAFIALVDGKVKEIQEKIVIETKATDKKVKVKADATEGATKGKTVKAKSKTKKPVAKVSTDAVPLNPEIAAAIEDIAVPQV